MSKTYIGAALRREVIERAGGCCEYCLSNSEDRAISFAIDHVIAEKHGGLTQVYNLRGVVIGATATKVVTSVRLIGMLTEQLCHFLIRVSNYGITTSVWDGVRIVPLTATGRVTVFLLQMNSVERIKERRLLVELGIYPCKKGN